MRTSSKFLFAFIFLFVFSCSKDGENSEVDSVDQNDNQDEIAGEEIIIEPLNSLGLLEFSIFSNSSAEEDKVIEGSDDTFNYFGYGESGLIQSAGIYIPKNLKKVTQYDPKTGVTNIIEVDNYFIPVKFQSVSNNSENDTIFTVQYDELKTDITVEVVDSQGTATIIDTISLNGISLSNTSGKSTSKNEDCEDPFSDATSFDICSDNNIYEEYGDDWENTSKYTIVKNVGKFINFIVKLSKEKWCPNNTQGKQQPLTCEDYKTPSKSYVKFLDTGEVQRFSSPLRYFARSNCTPPSRLYLINLIIDETGCYGFQDNNLPINMRIAEVYIYNDLSFYYATFYGNQATPLTLGFGVGGADSGEIDWKLSLQETPAGVFLIGNIKYGENEEIRPVEIAFRF